MIFLVAAGGVAVYMAAYVALAHVQDMRATVYEDVGLALVDM